MPQVPVKRHPRKTKRGRTEVRRHDRRISDKAIPDKQIRDRAGEIVKINLRKTNRSQSVRQLMNDLTLLVSSDKIIDYEYRENKGSYYTETYILVWTDDWEGLKNWLSYQPTDTVSSAWISKDATGEITTNMLFSNHER